MSESAWNDHLRYLEDELKKMSERADKLEEMIATAEGPQKKLALREIVSHLRDEISDLRKYLALVKPA